MKFTKKIMREAIAELRTKGATGTNSEVLHAYVGAEYKNFLNLINKGGLTDDAIMIAKKPVLHAIDLFNDNARYERLDELRDMKAKDAAKTKDAVKEYLRTQFVDGLVLTNSKKEGWCVAKTNEVMLDPNDFIAELFPTEMNGILDSVCIFADNLARFSFKDDSAKISRRSMSAAYVQMRERKGWDTPTDKLSWAVLTDQLNELAAMITCGVAPKMFRADTKFIDRAAIGVKDAGNKAGSFQTREEKTILRFVFRAIYTRYNGLSYAWQNDSRAVSQTPLSASANKAMAENPKSVEFSPEKPAEEAPVTVCTADSVEEEKK